MQTHRFTGCLHITVLNSDLVGCLKDVNEFKQKGFVPCIFSAKCNRIPHIPIEYNLTAFLVKYRDFP